MCHLHLAFRVLRIQTQALMLVWPVLYSQGSHFVMISLA